jgi:hypothetical protein
MQQSSFIGVLLARHVSGDFAYHQERRPVLQHVVLCTHMWYSAPSFVVLLCGYPGRLLRGPCVRCGGQCPIFTGVTLAFALQLRKKHG